MRFLMLAVVALGLLCGSESVQAQCCQRGSGPVARTVTGAARVVGRVATAPIRLLSAMRENAIERRQARRERRCG